MRRMSAVIQIAALCTWVGVANAGGLTAAEAVKAVRESGGQLGYLDFVLRGCRHAALADDLLKLGDGLSSYMEVVLEMDTGTSTDLTTLHEKQVQRGRALAQQQFRGENVGADAKFCREMENKGKAQKEMGLQALRFFEEAIANRRGKK